MKTSGNTRQTLRNIYLINKGIYLNNKCKLSRLKAVFTALLTLFDMGSDLILAVDYYNTGDEMWAFFLVPVILLLFVIAAMISDKKILPEALKEWKGFECMIESGPQLILQLYIMALPDANAVTGTGETNSTIIANMTVTPNTTFQLYSNSYETTLANFSINVTEQPDISLPDDSDISYTLILQVITVITSLLSISWGLTSYKVAMDEVAGNVPFNTMDYALDLTWNILCISPRILALSLFATVYTDWFWGIIGAHIFIMFLVLSAKNKGATKGDLAWQSLVFGIGHLFNILLEAELFAKYKNYFSYWFQTIIETVILISIWYVDTPDKNLWYHDAAIAYVIPAYFVSYFIKTYHVSTFENNKGKPSWEWYCSKMNKDMSNEEGHKSEGDAQGEENNIDNVAAVESVA